MPKFAVPEIFYVQEVLLKFFWCCVALFVEEAQDYFRIHYMNG